MEQKGRKHIIKYACHILKKKKKKENLCSCWWLGKGDEGWERGFASDWKLGVVVVGITGSGITVGGWAQSNGEDKLCAC